MQLRLTADDRAALREYWRFYEPRSAAIALDMRRRATELPDWKELILSRPAAESADEERRSLELQRAAILDDAWQPFLDEMRAQGARYAAAGVRYEAWFDLIMIFRDAFREHISTLLREDTVRHLPTARVATHGMNRLLDIAIANIGAAYLGEKERMLAASEERYRMLFEESPIPMWTFDRETLRFLSVNAAAVRQYGYTREELAHMTIASIRPPEDLADLRADVAADHGPEVRKMWRHRRKDGSLLSVEIEATDVVVDGRRARLVLATDVTERERARIALKKTEDQLRQAQKLEAIGRLAGGVAHDFNNVLTVIGSCAELVDEGLESGHPAREDITEIRRAAERGGGITRQLLAMSRHSMVAPRPLDLDEVIAGLSPMLRRLVGEDIAFAHHRTKVPPIVADRGQIEQVLMNLAVNARDAMPAGGRLTIELQHGALDAEAARLRGLPPGEYVTIAVTDTGTGIAPDVQARIFEPFFTTKDATRGTGLGLSIVHGIVSQAGGAIAVYSEVGHGTTFRVHLPVGEQHDEPATTTAASDQVPRSLPPLTVLVVDDREDVRSVAGRILRSAGCSVLESATAEEARRVCVSHEGTIDVALLDVVLSDARGDELSRQLCELRPTLSVMLMSGYPIGALTERGGAPPDLLPKPFSAAELRAAVARVAGATKTPLDGSPARAASASQQTRVLVADDDDVFRRTVVRALRRAQFDVVEVDSGRTAIAEIETGRFDVVLTDVQMPQGGGVELIRAVRRINLDLPVVLMTGAPDIASAAAAVEYGAFRYLTKPTDLGTLVHVTRHAARAHALARIRREALSVTGSHAGAVADRAGLEVRFDLAIEHLWMAYQPIVEARSGALFGIEALMRSDEPSMPSPPIILDAATQLGALARVGRRVRALAAGALASRTDNVALFVNLHPDDLSDVELLDDSSPLVQVASRVVLEITERASLTSSAELTSRIERLRKRGFRLAVDDIGAGYSGLTSFTDLEPEIVKIDMSLVRGVHQSALKQRTIAALCRLCHESNCLVVGEGVETVDERECLVALGCDLLQGYLIGRPVRQLPA